MVCCLGWLGSGLAILRPMSEVKHNKCNRKRSKTPHGHVLP